ncbi:MAG: PD40 domain-containing protein [Anaerolineae bacterium]|nr:PD40 domain-containing protein [Anaerolineae bacterium]
MLCPVCGQENREGAQFCAGCGGQLGIEPRAAVAAKPTPVEMLKRHRLAIGGGIGGIVLLCLGVVCIAVVALLVLPSLGGRDEILLAFPNGDGEADLCLLKLGQDQDQGTLLAEGVQSTYLSFPLIKDGVYQSRIGGSYGAFLPDSDRLFLWYRLDDDIVIQQMRIGDAEPIEVLESGADSLAVGFFIKPGLFAVRENMDGQARCHVAKLGQESEQLAKADYCYFSSDGSALLYKDESSRGEATLTVVDIARQKEEVLLDEFEGLGSTALSSDGSRVAYVQEDGGEYQLFLMERRSGEEVEVTDEVASVYFFGFPPTGRELYYSIREDEDDDEVQLYALSESDQPIAEGIEISLDFSPDGRYMYYVVRDDDGQGTLYARPVAGGEGVEVAEGEGVMFEAVRTSPARLLVVVLEGEDVTLLSADYGGNAVVELWSGDDVDLRDGAYLLNNSMLYLRIEDQGDGEDALFVTPVDKDTGFYLLEDWDSIQPMALSPNNRTLVFSAVEDSGDDPVLYSVEVKDGAEPVELDDDAEGLVNAVFTSDGRYVIYTAITGDDSDDREVRRVRADGGEEYETLYEEATLVDARWADRNTFWYFQ